MGDEANRSCEDYEKTKVEDSKPPNQGDEVKLGENDEDDKQRVSCAVDSGSDCEVQDSSGGESEAASKQMETLTSVQSDFDESSHQLSEVPVEYSLQPLQVVEELKDQVAAMREEPLKVLTSQPAQVQIQHQIHVQLSKTEQSPTSVSQSISSIPSPAPPEQKVNPVNNRTNLCISVPGKHSPRPKTLSVKSPSDGYNWRKYGQKQVKSPEGSRSYYRCTFSDCCAKKIECSDLSNHVIETVYRSPHNHDPPHRGTCTTETRHSPSITPANVSNCMTPRKTMVNDPVPLRLSEVPIPRIDQKPSIQPQESSGSDETMEDNNVKDACVDGPECKKRQKSSSNGEVSSLSKPVKKAKFVVHVAGDEGVSGDGYRWRKYGQKMVKGNAHPRNYYRCTSAGCPMRKHIERAVDNANAVVITYKGAHDHDIPVPRKRHSPKNALVVATSSVSVDN